MKRILIIGASGCGKSTLAKRVSTRLELPYVATDPFYWDADWKPVSMERVHQRLNAALEHDAWVLDGNFDNEREFLWTRADCIVWLDYALPIILSRVIFRNFGWAISGQTTWSGNQMSFQRAISGIRHSLRSYPMKKAAYPEYLAALSGVEIYRFRTDHETEVWFRALKNS